MIDLGKRIQDLVAENDMSINQLAKASGVPASTIKNITQGKSKNPGIETVAKLCKALGVTLAEFFEE